MKINFIKEYNANNNTIKVDFANDGVGDNVITEAYIQVVDDCDVEISGTTVDKLSASAVAIVDLSTLGIVEKITKAGIYTFDCSALSSITLSVTGQSKLVVKGMN